MSQPAPPAVGELGPDDLVVVLTELLDASVNWENIGLGLRLSPGILQALNVPNKLPWDCLRDMLREWLNRSPDPSWQSLIRVLRSPIVGKDTLASHLETKYLTQEGSVPPSGPLIATPNHPSPVCMATHVSTSRSLRMQPEKSANALPTPASLVISESCSDESERQLHASESGHNQCLPPSKRVKYSSVSRVDSLATSKQVDRASKGESHVLPSYNHSPLPEPQQVRSSSGPDTLQQTPFQGRPPSIPVAGESEGQLPPGYSLPHPAPMDTVYPNSTYHFPPPSRHPKFQLQEVQQISRYPPTHGSYLVPTPGPPKGQFGDFPEPQVVHSPPFQMSGSELVAHPSQLPLCEPFYRPGSQTHYPRLPLRSNPVFHESERQPPPGYCPPASIPRGRGITAPSSSLPAPSHSIGPGPLPQHISSYQTPPTAASIGTHLAHPAGGQPPRGYFPGSQQVPHLYSRAPPCGPSYLQWHLPPSLPPPSYFGPANYSHGQQAPSNDNKQVLHVGTGPQTYCLPPANRVRYSSPDLIASNQVALPVAHQGEGQPPPGYASPASIPRGTTAPNTGLPATLPSLEPRFQPQEVQQFPGYPRYQTPPMASSIVTHLVPTAGHHPPSGRGGDLPGSQQVCSHLPPVEQTASRQCTLPPYSAQLYPHEQLHSHSPQPSNLLPVDYRHSQPVSIPPAYLTVPPMDIEAGLFRQLDPQYSQHLSQCLGSRYGRGFGASKGFGYGNFSGPPGYPYPQSQYSSSSGSISNLPLSLRSHNLQLNQVQQFPGFMQSFRHANLDQLDPFADYLRETYEVQIPSFFATQWPPPPTRKVFNLSLIHSETIRCTAPNDELVRLLMTGCVPEYVRRNTSVELKDLFGLQSQGRKFVLIEGAPGSGKSTLAWHIVQKWKARELFQEFKIVIFVQLRDPEIQAAQSVADLLPTDSEERKKDAVSRMRSCCGKGVLFILDGWDEYPLGRQKGSPIEKLICEPQKLDLQFSTLLVTSRPITSAVLHWYASSRVEVVGFTPIEVRQYFKETLGDAMSVRNLEEQLKGRPVVEASCFLPLNASIVVHLFRELDHVLPPTLHGVFSALVCGCLVRHLSKQSNGEEIPEIPSLEEIPSIIQIPFEGVCNLAYRGAMNDKVTFSRQDLSSYELSADLNVLSLMQGVQSFAGRKSMLYHFLHLSVQELLAAHHVSKLPQSQQVQVFKELFNQPRFAAVFRFYAAFTKLQTEGIRDVVTSIVQSNENTHLLNLLHCLYESQDSSLCSFVASQLNGSLDLSEYTLSPLDCLSVGYFLSCVYQTTEGEFKVNLYNCSLNDYSVRFLVKELSKCDCPSPRVEGAAAHVALPGCLALDLVGNQIKGGGVRCLSELISRSNVVSKLDLSLNKVQEDGDGLMYLLQGLRTNTSIVEVVLDSCSLRVTEDNGPLLVDMLRENTTLKVLYFSFNHDLLTRGLGYLGKGLCCTAGLVQLSISQCGLTGKEAKSLAKALMENNTVKSLDLSDNELGSDGIFHISSSLKVNSTLQKLNLMTCSLSAEDIKVLVDSLLSKTSLVSLGLSYNPISDAGAAHIADLLKHNTRLAEVRLAECSITDGGAQSLAAALREHNSLEVLVLRGNHDLFDTGVAAIAEALRHNHKLRDLDIGRCRLTDQGMESIATALEVNTSLETLNISDNTGITDRGLLTLGESLKKNKGLKTLGLDHLEQVTTGGRNLFLLCLKENHHLTSLRVGLSDRLRFSSIFGVQDAQITASQEVVAVNEARQQQGLPLLEVT